MIDQVRLESALRRARGGLFRHWDNRGFWKSGLSASALSTATAVSAFSLVYKHLLNGGMDSESACRRSTHSLSDEELAAMKSLVVRADDWLVDRQNEDGGWGDTDRSRSNIATTVLVKSALLLANYVYDNGNVDISLNGPGGADPQRRGSPGSHRRSSPYHDSIVAGWSMDTLAKTDLYIRRHGGIDGIKKRYGEDQTFSAPILTNAALAGFVPWSEVPVLPFELASFPQAFFRFLRMPVVSYAIPALVAIGQCKFHHCPTSNIFARSFRKLTRKKTLALVEHMQPESGGFLEAAPLTAFVVMSLASIGHADHPVVAQGVRFLLDTVRPDASWPIDTNLDCWTTTLAVNALGDSALGGDALRDSVNARGDSVLDGGIPESTDTLRTWILACRHTKTHPFTGAAPGGWGWTNLSGAVPDADDTAGALLALAVLGEPDGDEECKKTFLAAVTEGITWLQTLQNRDGGFPTFCRGWGKMPFDRSSTDLTAHAVRAISRWSSLLGCPFDGIWSKTIRRGLAYLADEQRPDGSWLPLWFGNENRPDDRNPFYGTAKVLRMFGELEPALKTTYLSHIEKAIGWTLANRNDDGGWGGDGMRSSIEESALTIESLSFFTDRGDVRRIFDSAVEWLLSRVEDGSFEQPSPIGLYFAKLWYYETLYPLLFTVAALERVRNRADS